MATRDYLHAGIVCPVHVHSSDTPAWSGTDLLSQASLCLIALPVLLLGMSRTLREDNDAHLLWETCNLSEVHM